MCMSVGLVLVGLVQQHIWFLSSWGGLLTLLWLISSMACETECWTAILNPRPMLWCFQPQLALEAEKAGRAVLRQLVINTDMCMHGGLENTAV